MTPLVDIVTTARADYGLISPVVEAVARRSDLDVRAIFSGAHFSQHERPLLDEHRRRLGVPTEIVPCRNIGRDELSSGLAVSESLAGFVRLWAQRAPAICVMPGDRFEMAAPATAAVLLGIPIAHMYGGEMDLSYCLDTQIRNALTKIAHLHFVTHDAMRCRLLGMGEEDWRITVCGNPAIAKATDRTVAFLAHAEEMGWGKGPFIAACYLPPTTLRDQWTAELEALLEALGNWRCHRTIWTGSNVDPGAADVRARLKRHCDDRENHVFVAGLGTERYHGLLQSADVMVGNSSSGLLEAGSFGLPVVNVGARQSGRLSGNNVINVPGNEAEIAAGLRTAIADAAFRQRVREMGNPFQRPDSARRIADRLADALRGDRSTLMLKRAVAGNPREYKGLQRVPEYPIHRAAQGIEHARAFTPARECS